MLELQKVVFLVCHVLEYKLRTQLFIYRAAKIDTLLEVLKPKFVMVCSSCFLIATRATFS